MDFIYSIFEVYFPPNKNGEGVRMHAVYYLPIFFLFVLFILEVTCV